MSELNHGLLDGACGYLSGPMEFVADHGIEWRRKFVKQIKEANLNIDLIDPTDNPGGIDEKIGENKQFQSDLKKQGKWDELQKYVKKYRRYDLRFVDLSDFLVVVIDPRVPQWGTANEVYAAETQHKPCFFICDGGLPNLPNWLFDIIDLPESNCPEKRCNVFAKIEDVVEELRLIDSGKIQMSDEWALIRKHIEINRINFNKIK